MKVREGFYCLLKKEVKPYIFKDAPRGGREDHFPCCHA
jgi:hypothetical protein